MNCPKCSEQCGSKSALRSHIRHTHTDYEEEVHKRIQHYIRIGMRPFEAKLQAKAELRGKLPKIG